MKHRFPIDYPFGPRYIPWNGIIFGMLVMGIGITIGSIIGRILQ